MSNAPSKPSKIGQLFNKIPPFLVVLISGILIFIAMLFMTPDRESVPDSQLPWNSEVLSSGQIQVIGLTSHQTTVLEAQRFYKDDITIKVFSKKDESEKSAEVFFPSVHIGTIHAALVLKLNVEEEMLEEIYNRGVKITITESGNREVVPTQADDLFLKDQTFSLLTLIPRKSLPAEAIIKRFGEPGLVERQSDGLDHWFYPEKGLELIYNPDGPEALQYYPM